MNCKIIGAVLAGFVLNLSFNANAQQARSVGKKAADAYFVKRKEVSQTTEARPVSREPASGGSARYLALHVGTFFDDEAYVWGKKNPSSIGRYTAGVTYRVGEWTNSMDLLFRADFISYKLDEGQPLKMSLLPMIIFPDANSQFPLYFGAGIGLGVYFKQIEEESALSLDYQLVAGVRFFDVFDTIGFMVETGIKNHFHLLSDGQYNGVFLSGGAVFAF